MVTAKRLSAGPVPISDQAASDIAAPTPLTSIMGRQLDPEENHDLGRCRSSVRA
jgi:hypothetical protein